MNYYKPDADLKHLSISQKNNVIQHTYLLIRKGANETNYLLTIYTDTQREQQHLAGQKHRNSINSF